jgi:hypothetical protein
MGTTSAGLWRLQGGWLVETAADSTETVRGTWLSGGCTRGLSSRRRRQSTVRTFSLHGSVVRCNRERAEGGRPLWRHNG